MNILNWFRKRKRGIAETIAAVGLLAQIGRQEIQQTKLDRLELENEINKDKIVEISAQTKVSKDRLDAEERAEFEQAQRNVKESSRIILANLEAKRKELESKASILKQVNDYYDHTNLAMARLINCLKREGSVTLIDYSKLDEAKRQYAILVRYYSKILELVKKAERENIETKTFDRKTLKEIEETIQFVRKIISETEERHTV